jgi:hypothetical protein
MIISVSRIYPPNNLADFYQRQWRLSSVFNVLKALRALLIMAANDRLARNATISWGYTVTRRHIWCFPTNDVQLIVKEIFLCLITYN